MFPAEIKSRLVKMDVPSARTDDVIVFFTAIYRALDLERERTFDARVERRALEVADERAQAYLIGVPEAAILVGVTKKTIYRGVWDRTLPFYKPGKRLLFRRAEVKAWSVARQCPSNVHQTPVQIEKSEDPTTKVAA